MSDMDWLTNPQIWIGLLTLTALEIVLGIDNIVFISVLASKLSPASQGRQHSGDDDDTGMRGSRNVGVAAIRRGAGDSSDARRVVLPAHRATSSSRGVTRCCAPVA